MARFYHRVEYKFDFFKVMSEVGDDGKAVFEGYIQTGFGNLTKLLADDTFKLNQCGVCNSYYERGRNERHEVSC